MAYSAQEQILDARIEQSLIDEPITDVLLSRNLLLLLLFPFFSQAR